jgi:hypothetical protein
MLPFDITRLPRQPTSYARTGSSKPLATNSPRSGNKNTLSGELGISGDMMPACLSREIMR